MSMTEQEERARIARAELEESWARGMKAVLEEDAKFWSDQAAEMERVRREEGPEAAARLQAERDELNRPKYPMGTDYRFMCSVDIAAECNRGARSGRGVPEFMDCLAKNNAPGLKIGMTNASGTGTIGGKSISDVVMATESVLTDY